jgi:hypothetical protein
MHEATVELVGETATTVTLPGSLPVVDRQVAFECASGETIERSYRGVPVRAVLSWVDLPGETTHLLVGARDGHVACVSVPDALDGVLALDGSGGPRLVAPGILGPRAIKRVERLEAVVLAGDEDPEDLERVPPDAEA